MQKKMKNSSLPRAPAFALLQYLPCRSRSMSFGGSACVTYLNVIYNNVVIICTNCDMT